MMCMDLSWYCKSQDELIENIQPQLISKSSDSASISQENEICLRNNDCVSLTLPNDNNSKVEDNDSVDNNVCNVENRHHFDMNKQRSSSLQDLTGCTSVWNQGAQSRTTPRLVSSDSKDSGLPLSSSCVSLCSGEKNYNCSVKDRVKSNYVREPCIDILYRELEEKDAMLEKLQEKYNELLVLYAESRNMIDKLRCHSCNENVVDKPFETSKDWKRFSFSSQLSDLTLSKKQSNVSDHISDRPFSIYKKPSTDSLQSVGSSSESSVSKVQRWQHSWSSNSTDDCIPQMDQNLSDNSDTDSIVSTPSLQNRSECPDKPDIPFSRNIIALEEPPRCKEEKTEVNDDDSNSKNHSAEENNVLLFLTRVEECAKQLHAQSVAVKRATVSLCQKQS